MNYLSKMLIVAVTLLAEGLSASAYDFMSGGIAYNVNADGKTATVTYLERRKSTNYDQLTEANIPQTVINAADGKSYTVTTIGESAFYSNKTIKKLTIPPTIVKMEDGAFGSSLPSTGELHITDLAQWCRIDFANATANPLYSGMPIYVNGEKLTNLVIPQGVNAIATYAFHRYKGLETLKIDTNVSAIGRHAFSQCSNLTSVEITGNVSRIDSSAFQSCSKLVTVSLPASVDTIGPSAFASCSSLTEFAFPPNVRNIPRGALQQCSKLQRVVLGSMVETIGQTAFNNCKVLKEINFPAALRAIGSNAFNNCSSLENINLPLLCSDVRHNAFNNTKWLNAQPEGMVYAGYVAYTYKGTMPENFNLVLRDSIVGIAQYAFYNQKNLTKVTLPFTMYDLGGWCFSQCSNITEVHCKMMQPKPTPSQYNLYGDWTVFYNCNLGQMRLVVPIGCKVFYTATNEWSRFGEIVEEGLPIGDITGDTLVDVDDVNALVNIILGLKNATYYKGTADVNSSGIVDVDDVNIVINIILGLNVFNPI